MPSKYYLRNFVPGHHYHVYNRGSHKQNILLDKEDHYTFIDILSYYLKFPTGSPRSILARQNKPKSPNKVRNLVEATSTTSFHLACFCLMPNHFHFLFKQLKPPTQENSITNLMRRLSITYAMFFNHKHNYSGGLFQGKYKNVHITTEEQLLYLTKYIHQNPLEINQDVSSYPHSSYQYYLKPDTCPLWLHHQEILTHFSTTNPDLTYQSFVNNHQINLSQELRLD